MPENAKQRLVDLSVGEISLVDMPANEEDFMVIKSMNMAARGFVEMTMEMLHRIEEMGVRLIHDGMDNELPVPEVMAHVKACTDMLRSKAMEKAAWTGAFINDLPDSSFLYIEPGGKKDADGKTTPRSLRHFPYKDGDGKVDLPHLRNALARIPQSDLPDGVKDKLTSQAQDILERETKKDKEKSMADPVNKDKQPTANDKLIDEISAAAEGLVSALDKAKAGGKGKMPPWMEGDGKDGKKGKGVKKTLTDLAVAIGQLFDTQADGVQKSDTKPEDTKQTEEQPAAGTTIQVMQDGTVVVKGARQFTKERISRLKDSLGNLLGLVKDADPDAYTEMLAGLNAELKGQPTSKSEVAKSKDGTPTEEPPAWFKAAMDKVTEVATSVEDVTKRLDSMEKGQAVSKSLPEGGTDKPVAKDKSFWHGVL